MLRQVLLVSLVVASSGSIAQSLGDARAARERGDLKGAVEILAVLAERGDPDAIANLGNAHAFGEGVPKDLTVAAVHWRRAAELGVPTAIGNIAVLYKTGQGGLPKDDALAAAWYKRAAEHRHAQSMITLSSLYMLGEGIAQDRISALAWAGLAETNSPPGLKQAAGAQLRRIAEGMSKEEIQQAQQKSNDLLKVIDANVARYKRQ